MLMFLKTRRSPGASIQHSTHSLPTMTAANSMSVFPMARSAPSGAMKHRLSNSESIFLSYFFRQCSSSSQRRTACISYIPPNHWKILLTFSPSHQTGAKRITLLPSLLFLS
jgi:hypothetical protein